MSTDIFLQYQIPENGDENETATARLRALGYNGTDGAALRVLLDGNILGEVSVPNLGNWSDKQTMTIAGVDLRQAPNALLRIEITGDGVDINWVEFAKSDVTRIGQHQVDNQLHRTTARQYEITTIDGRFARRINTSDHRISQSDFAGLSCGVYFGRMKNQHGADSRRVQYSVRAENKGK